MKELREVIENTLLKIAKDFNPYADWYISIKPSNYHVNDNEEVFELKYVNSIAEPLIIQFFDDCSYEVYNEGGELLVMCDKNNQTNKYDRNTDHYGLMEVFWQSDVIKNMT